MIPLIHTQNLLARVSLYWYYWLTSLYDFPTLCQSVGIRVGVVKYASRLRIKELIESLYHCMFAWFFTYTQMSHELTWLTKRKTGWFRKVKYLYGSLYGTVTAVIDTKQKTVDNWLLFHCFLLNSWTVMQRRFGRNCLTGFIPWIQN